MQGKKKKTRKQIKVQDLKPRKDAKGGMPQSPSHDTKCIFLPVINVVIEPQTDLLTIIVRFDDSISIEELRAAWKDVSSGVLQRHIRDAIYFECVRRGIEAGQVVPDDHADSN